MQADYIYILDQDKVREAIDKIVALETGSKYLVTISNAGDKTKKQRGYEWRLYTDIIKSGVGRNDTAEAEHIDCKWRFALPIFIRDDDFFSDLYFAYKELHGHDTERMRWFVANMVHTEKMNTSQMAEYLTMMINFYIPLGATLSDPKDYGLKMAA